VPIHVCAPKSAGEFACLYLTTVQGPHEQARTQHAAKAAHMYTLVETMQKALSELKHMMDVKT
jgi:hypothetical protein